MAVLLIQLVAVETLTARVDAATLAVAATSQDIQQDAEAINSKPRAFVTHGAFFVESAIAARVCE